MPYCPKCGVELDYRVKNCPLCTFPVPKTTEENEFFLEESKFPEAENIYYEKILKVKNQIFFTLSILIFSAVFILMAINSFINISQYAIKYSIISVISSWFYVFLLFGYIKNHYYSILGMGITTFCLTFGLDYVDYNVTWCYSHALPIIILSIIISFFLLYLYNRSKFKNQFIFIPSHLCVGISLFSIGLEYILNHQSNRPIKFTWSLIVSIVLMSTALLLISLYYRLPDKLKEKIKSKLHI